MKALPAEAQFSPIFGTVAVDFNDDGNLDILSVGNSYSAEPLAGLYDAGIGTCMQGDGKGDFKFIPVTKSGLFVDKDAKGLAEINLGNKKVAWITTANRDSIKMFERSSQQQTKIINVLPDDAFAELIYANGKKRKHEFYYGSSYLSQSSRMLELEDGVREVYITNVKGDRRRYDSEK
jgi:hypothetical protein